MGHWLNSKLCFYYTNRSHWLQLRLCFIEDEVIWTPLSIVISTSPAKHNEYINTEYFCNGARNRSALSATVFTTNFTWSGRRSNSAPEVTGRRLTVRAPEWPGVLDYHSQYWRQVLVKQNRSGRHRNEETVGTILYSKNTKCILIRDVSLFWHFKLKQIPSTMNVSYNFR